LSVQIRISALSRAMIVLCSRNRQFFVRVNLFEIPNRIISAYAAARDGGWRTTGHVPLNLPRPFVPKKDEECTDNIGKEYAETSDDKKPNT
jgi:hypothetical protein